MRRIFLLAVIASLFLVSFGVSGVDTGGIGIGINVPVEESIPLVWLGSGRVVLDDNVEPGRFTSTTCSVDPVYGDEILCERTQNYAFEGESIYWPVLAYDANGAEDITLVSGTISSVLGPGGDREVTCDQDTLWIDTDDISMFSASVNGVALISFDSGSMKVYDCRLTVETPDSMPPNEYWLTVEACSDPSDSNTCSTIVENEYWYLNPEIALTIDSGDPTGQVIDFGTVTPGVVSYSNSIAVGNGADPLSGVMLDMFISGTDFYDPLPSGAKCPTTNQLALTNFRYYAVNGAYGTATDPRADAEDYVTINYGINIMDSGEIICAGSGLQGMPTGVRTGAAGECDYDSGVEAYTLGNVLSPGADISITFKLDVPMPCSGDFSDGDILFWGEVI